LFVEGRIDVEKLLVVTWILLQVILMERGKSQSLQTFIVYWRVYPRNRYACGLLAWTGNDVLNRCYKL
jgi:hypothetical protein